MLILIDDDFSHLYIPTEQVKTVSIFFLRSIMIFIIKKCIWKIYDTSIACYRFENGDEKLL